MTRLLEMCGIRSADVVTILFDETTDEPVLEATRLAADRIRTQTAVVRTTSAGAPQHPAITAAVGASAFVVDLTSNCTGVTVVTEVAGTDGASPATRVFSLDARSTDDLSWFVPHPGLSERLDRALECLERADVFSVVSQGEHRLDVSMREVHVATDSGVLDATTHARFPGGALTVTPGDGTVNGSLALMPGDINVSAHRFISSPVVLVVDNDRVCDILGTGADADLVRAQFEAAESADAYGVGALTIGLNRTWPRAHGFDDKLLTRDRATLSGGHTTVRFGTNSLAGRVVSDRIEFALRRASVMTDHDELVALGRLLDGLAPDIYEQAAFDEQ